MTRSICLCLKRSSREFLETLDVEEREVETSKTDTKVKVKRALILMKQKYRKTIRLNKEGEDGNNFQPTSI